MKDLFCLYNKWPVENPVPSNRSRGIIASTHFAHCAALGNDAGMLGASIMVFDNVPV